MEHSPTRPPRKRAPYRVRAPLPGCPPSRKWLRKQAALARVPWTEQWMRTQGERDLCLMAGLLAQRVREAAAGGKRLSEDEQRQTRLVKAEQLRRLYLAEEE